MNKKQQLLEEFEKEEGTLTIEGFLNFLVRKVQHLEAELEKAQNKQSEETFQTLSEQQLVSGLSA